MKKRKGRRRRRHARFEPIRGFALYLLSRPGRFCLFAVASLALAWVVITKSLPFALASKSPDLALVLNANNPEALISKASEKRQRLLAFERGPENLPWAKSAGIGETSNLLAHLPEVPAHAAADPLTESAALKLEIAKLASRTIAIDPLNATAFRLLAETYTDPEQVRGLMEEAVKRSRREAPALFYLLNESLYKKNYARAIALTDILLRTKPELSNFLVIYLWSIAASPGGLTPVVETLEKQPVWRGAFFVVLPQLETFYGTALNLMSALKHSAAPPSAKELAPYLDSLIAHDRPDAAYGAWLSTLPEPEVGRLEFLTNGGFENDPSGLPFDWRIKAGLNAIVEFVPSAHGPGRLLHIIFQTGRVTFPDVFQTVVLPAGRYRLEGRVRGRLKAKRGLRWELRCAGASQRVFAQTDMLSGESEQWRIFSLDAEVPQDTSCIGQTIRLFHDSRSSSEEFIDGEVWFSDLKLSRTDIQNVTSLKQ